MSRFNRLAVTLCLWFAGQLAIAAPPVQEATVIQRRSWGPEQATGKPDTPGAGDIETAWASATEDGQDEWLELEYAEAVEPEQIIIHETFNPGAVYMVTAYTRTGMEALLWHGEDPTRTGLPRGVSEINVTNSVKTNRIRVHLKSSEVPGWNEIDAVGIKDTAGDVHWAVKAKASSTYAENGGAAIEGFVVPLDGPRGIIPVDAPPAIQRAIRLLRDVTGTERVDAEAVRRADEERRTEIEEALRRVIEVEPRRQ